MRSYHRAIKTGIVLFLLFSAAVWYFVFESNVFSTQVSGSGAQATATWNSQANTAGYRLYYGLKSKNYSSVIDVGAQNTYTVTNLAAGTTYYFAVTAYNSSGAESDYSKEASYTTPAISATNDTGSVPQSGAAGSSGGGGSKCFIATAAYGSYLDPHVMVLRDFRERLLVTNGAGRRFLAFYYKYSPSAADYIRKHETLRIIVRGLLTPVVFGIEHPYGSGLFVLLLGLCVGFRTTRASARVRGQRIPQVGPTDQEIKHTRGAE